MSFSLGQLFKPAMALALFSLCIALAPAQALQSGNSELNHPRVELYAGYSYWRPVNNSTFYGGTYFQPETTGSEGSLTYFLKPWLGIKGEVGDHIDPNLGHIGTSGAGIQLQTSVRRFVPFAHVLAGPTYFGTGSTPKHYGWMGTVGGGIDWIPSLRHQWFGLRLVQADYQYLYNSFGPQPGQPALHNAVAHFTTVAGSAGIVFRLGGGEHVSMEPQMTCSADRLQVAAGEPVNVISQNLGFSMKEPMTYNWNASAGRITGTGETITIDTTGLPSGDYKVAGSIVQGGRRGARQAMCSTGFTVRSPEPPSISCVASPSSIPPGGSSTLTASGISPQGRTLTYSFSTATLGRIPSVGNTATVTARGSGDIVVTCSAQDDLGHTVSATAVVNVSSAAPQSLPAVASSALAPLPLQRDMCSVAFDRDRRRPARVDNEAKACLDDIALAMQREQDSTLVLVGDHAGAEAANVAAERALNVKQYLTTEKGIDPARVQLRAEDAGARRVTAVFLSIGATFNEEGRPVTESQVVRHGEAYGTRSATRRSAGRRRPAVRRRRRSAPAASTP